MKFNLLSTILIAGSLCATAQPVLVKDINTTGDGNPCWVTGFGNKVAFFADNGTDGMELWAYDTAASLQYNINPGAANGGLLLNNSKMAEAGGYLYFPADNGSTGLELYRWNGTNAPEVAVDVNPSGSAGVSEVYAYDGRIYFNAITPANGIELWSYTISNGYTQRLTDIVAGAGNSSPYGFIGYKGRLYFAATSTSNGTELYAYNPANNTVSLAADINAGAGSSSPQGFMVANNKMYFSATTPAFGRELYVFDSVNIQRLTNVDNSGMDGLTAVPNNQSQLFWYKNKIYFSGNNGTSGAQFFQYNPANGVASVVYNINPSSSSNPEHFTYYGGKLFFTADDGTHGDELWAYDGMNNPYLAANVDTNIGAGSFPMNLLRWGTKLYFSAFTIDNGTELYRFSDSTALGIQKASFNAEVSVYPNPTTANVNIKIGLSKNMVLGYSITDISGRMIASKDATQYSAGNNLITVDMQNAAAGLYTYRLYDATGNMLATGKFQKQ